MARSSRTIRKWASGSARATWEAAFQSSYHPALLSPSGKRAANVTEVSRFFDAGQEAHGFIAVGQLATGVIAIGQSALGVIAIGQLSRGVFAVGQLSFGVFSVGMGSVAIFGTVAMGASPVGAASVSCSS